MTFVVIGKLAKKNCAVTPTNHSIILTAVATYKLANTEVVVTQQQAHPIHVVIRIRTRLMYVVFEVSGLRAALVVLRGPIIIAVSWIYPSHVAILRRVTLFFLFRKNAPPLIHGEVPAAMKHRVSHRSEAIKKVRAILEGYSKNLHF